MESEVGMGEDHEDRWSFLQVIPVAWLLLVLVGYALVVFAPADNPTAPVPGLAEADRVAGPLLAALLLTGIIKCFSLRRASRQSASKMPSGQG